MVPAKLTGGVTHRAVRTLARGHRDRRRPARGRAAPWRWSRPTCSRSATRCRRRTSTSSTTCSRRRRSRWWPSSSRASAALDKFDVVEALARVPTTVICGTDDKITSIGHSRKLHDRIAGSTLLECEGAGHMVILERHDQVNAALDQLISAAAERVGAGDERRTVAPVGRGGRRGRARGGPGGVRRPAGRSTRPADASAETVESVARPARGVRRPARRARRAPGRGAGVRPGRRARCTCAASASCRPRRGAASPRTLVEAALRTARGARRRRRRGRRPRGAAGDDPVLGARRASDVAARGARRTSSCAARCGTRIGDVDAPDAEAMRALGRVAGADGCGPATWCC